VTEHKSIAVKAAEDGTFVAEFARYGIRDLDSDVVVKGAFDNGASVKVAAWGHAWHQLPAGIATIHEDGDRVLAKGSFFMDTTHGLDTFRTVKGLGDLGEWSWGFEVLDSEYGEHEGKRVRFIKRVKTFEVSPVFRGAGPTTHTESIKSAPDDDDTERRIFNLLAFEALSS
jgi:HK97 family phage prohead protease